jgi:AsmA protein
MGKLLKFILGLVVLAAGLLIVLAVALPFIIDPNDYKDQIAAKVQENTGRTLSIDGDISLSVFPWLGLDIGPTRLSNAQGFGEQPMASMEKVQVRVKLLPLLHKQLEMDTIRLSGLRLQLGKDASGRGNWDDLRGAAGEKAQTGAAHPDEAAGSSLAGLAIGGVAVTDARVLWDDRSTGSRYELNELSFTTGAIDPGKPFDLDLHFRMNAREPAVAGEITLRGKILVATSLRAINMDGADLNLDLQGEGAPGGRLRLSLVTDIAVDPDRQTLQMPKLALETPGLKITGHASGTGISGEDPRFTGALSVAEFAPRELIKALGQEPPVTADGTVLGKAGAVMQWEASKRQASATSLQFQLDDTHVDGKLRVDNFAKPAIDFALQADQIDLDRYLPPPAEDAPASPASPAAAARAGRTPAGRGLRDLNLPAGGSAAEATTCVPRISSSEIGTAAARASGQPVSGAHGEDSLDVRENPRLS